jgi:hypothetical protein
MADDKKRRGAGLKINNDRSNIKTPETTNEVSFDEKAAAVKNRMEEHKKVVWELSGKFKAMIEDQTLPENKTIISKGLEKEVLDKLIEIATMLNTDQVYPEGWGSSALGMLFMKMFLLQRDAINTMAFKIDKLEKQLFVKKTSDNER